MPYLRTALTWISMLAIVVPLALMLLIAIPTGAIASIAMHAIVLVGGAAIVLALQPPDDPR